MANRIQFKRGVKASLPTLSVGEPAITTDSKEFYLGSAAGNMSVAMDNDVPSVPVVLSPGVQTIRADRTSRLAHVGFKGRTLVNLLGREGNCESITSWSVVGTRALDSAVKTSGSNSIKLTLSGANGNINQIVSAFVTGKKYVMVADVKNGNATSGCVSVSEVIDGNLVSSTSFSPSILRFTATKTSHVVAFVGFGSSGQTINIDSIRIYEISDSEYTAIGSMTAAQVAAKYPYTESIANVDNVYVHRLGTYGAVEQALYAYDMQAGSNVDGSVRDEVYTDMDGQLRINRRFKTMALTGDLPWEYMRSNTVCKVVLVASLGTSIASTPQGVLIRYDGRLGINNLTGVTAFTADMWQLGNTGYNDFFLSIPNTDSGWGDTYMPTSDEIKAYFYGWKMWPSNEGNTSLLYNRTDGLNKGWVRRRAADGALLEGTATLPTTFAPEYIPYQFQYQLASPVDEPISHEGAITLLSRSNQIEIGSGVIVRDPVISSSYDNMKYINADESFRTDCRVAHIFQVYKNSLPDHKWSRYVRPTGDSRIPSLGTGFASIPAVDYAPSTVYTVTYMALDTYLTGLVPLTITADIAANLRGAVDGAVTDIAALTGRVDVLESGKAEVEQPGWTDLLLLNGWVNFGSQYPTPAFRVINSGRTLQLRGMISSGITTGGRYTISFLPERATPKFYRTQVSIMSAVAAYQEVPCRINITPGKELYLANNSSGNGNYVVLDNLQFDLY